MEGNDFWREPKSVGGSGLLDEIHDSSVTGRRKSVNRRGDRSTSINTANYVFSDRNEVAGNRRTRYNEGMNENVFFEERKMRGSISRDYINSLTQDGYTPTECIKNRNTKRVDFGNSYFRNTDLKVDNGSNHSDERKGLKDQKDVTMDWDTNIKERSVRKVMDGCGFEVYTNRVSETSTIGIDPMGNPVDEEYYRRWIYSGEDPRSVFDDVNHPKYWPARDGTLSNNREDILKVIHQSRYRKS